jgi:hypothetical protein
MIPVENVTNESAGKTRRGCVVLRMREGLDAGRPNRRRLKIGGKESMATAGYAASALFSSNEWLTRASS